MGLIGYRNGVSAANRTFSGSGGGRGYRTSNDYKLMEDIRRINRLRRARKAMVAVEGYRTTDSVEIPARTGAGSRSLYISKKRNIKHRNLIIIGADPNGVNLPEIGIDFSKYSVVAVYDKQTICLLEKETGDMLMLDITMFYEYGPHGDYSSEVNPFVDGTKGIDKSDFYLTRFKFSKINSKGEYVDYVRAPEEFNPVCEKCEKHYADQTEAFKFVSAIQDKLGDTNEKLVKKRHEPAVKEKE